MKKIMETMNNLIEEQVHSRTCIPLRPDLQIFYEKIIGHQKNIKNLQQPAKIFEEIEEMKLPHKNRPQRSLNDINKIHEKYDVVKKLLNQYDELSPADQIQVRDMKIFLENHISFLDEMEFSTRKTRSLDGNDTVFAKRWLNENVVSEKFLKLAKTAGFIRKNVLFDEDNPHVDEYFDD